MTLESRFHSQSTVNFKDHFPLCMCVISCVSFVFKMMPELRDQLVAGIKPLNTNHHFCSAFSYVCMCKCAPLCPPHLSQGLGLEWVRMTRNQCRRLHFLKPSIKFMGQLGAKTCGGLLVRMIERMLWRLRGCQRPFRVASASPSGLRSCRDPCTWSRNA